MAQLVDKAFREMYPDDVKYFAIDSDVFIRSLESCRVDFLKWRARFDKNTNRPYFEGHERDDLKKSRLRFIKNFMDNRDLCFFPFFYFWILNWNKKKRKKRTLIIHDESAFIYGKMSAFKWIFPQNVPFFNKGRGQSIILSFFIYLFI